MRKNLKFVHFFKIFNAFHHSNLLLTFKLNKTNNYCINKHERISAYIFIT